ncbi:Catabolite control protein [Cedecea lapagei]|uniref:Catabolite control protein n=1 Tax=Cedecea lapagei TaxID=158823 RepID=A0A447V529_9ENTR|nr:LacI family DNA-binding transcriptional regulator [Cedecea lapagei]VEB99529.1 Catabolite control protein [Cedecea lapagei]
MANIRDVARQAGVSISSVSNLLNNRLGQMSKTTREKIEHAIATLNYRPALAAKGDEKSPTEIIGLMVPSIINPSFSALVEEINLAARALEHRVVLGNVNRHEDEERAFINDMLKLGVSGMIVAASDVRKTHFIQAAERGMAIVSYDNRFTEMMAAESRLFDSVSMDNMAAGHLAASHLLQRGCRNIVFATESTLTLSRSHKIAGFKAALNQYNLPREGSLLEGTARHEYGDSEMYELGLSLADTLLSLEICPDGVVAINDALAIGLIAGLRQAKIHIPQQISLVGIDNISLSALASPGLTSVRPPLAKMAGLMVQRLIARMNNAALPVDEFLFPPELVIRQSVR